MITLTVYLDSLKRKGEKETQTEKVFLKCRPVGCFAIA